MLSDGKSPATEEQLEVKEARIIEYEKREYLAQHIILSTTSIRLGGKIKALNTAEAMWKVVKADATTKSKSTAAFGVKRVLFKLHSKQF